MRVSAFQTHSEVGVGEEWGWAAAGWVVPGPCGILGTFLRYLMKEEGGSTISKCLWPFQEDVLPTSSFHNREAEVTQVTARTTQGPGAPQRQLGSNLALDEPELIKVNELWWAGGAVALQATTAGLVSPGLILFLLLVFFSF